MSIPWKDARRLIPNLDEILREQDAVAGKTPPAPPAPVAPICTRLTVAPGLWKVTIEGWYPASDNVRARGTKAWIRAKKADREVLRDWLAEYARVPRATGRRRVTVWVAKKGPRPDGTNLWKSLADGLVNVGLLVDDSAEWFEAGPIEVAKADVTSTTLLIEDIP
jgi:hypothetical protein